ncbi:hypothetical protein BH10ACT10_BH10ACT10_12060 [soil metagenome]
MGGPLHARPKVAGREDRRQEQTPLEESGELRVGRGVARPVGPEHHHQGSLLRPRGKGPKEGGPFTDVGAEGERLLTLVDHQGAAAGHRRVLSQRVRRMPPGGHNDDPLSGPQQGCHHAGPGQRRLAAPGGSDHREHALGVQSPQTVGYCRLTTEEALAVVRSERQESLVGTFRPGVGWQVSREQPRILLQDRPLESDEIRPRVEPELRRQRGPDLTNRAQCLGLSPRLVLGESEKPPTSFAQGGLGDQALRLRQHLPTPTGADRRVDPQLLEVLPQLVEAGRLDPPHVPRLEVGQRRTTPELERLVEHVRRALGLAQGQQLTGAVVKTVELDAVEVVAGHREAVSVPDGLDRIGTEGLSEPHHAALQNLGPGVWRPLPPHRLSQTVAGEHLSRVDRERRQDHSVARTQTAAVAVDGERPEHRDAHPQTVYRPREGVKVVDTGPIPVRWDTDTRVVNT